MPSLPELQVSMQVYEQFSGKFRRHEPSTPASRRAFTIWGRNTSAIFSCISRVSTALHTPGRWVLAFRMIFFAISGSAAASTYIWQMPSRCLMTGILLYSVIVLISPFPPLGITTSINLSIISSWGTSSLSVDFITCTASGGNPSFFRAALMHLPSAILVFIASLPPRSIAAFPLFMQRTAASIVTFGLDSKIMRVTPAELEPGRAAARWDERNRL